MPRDALDEWTIDVAEPRPGLGSRITVRRMGSAVERLRERNENRRRSRVRDAGVEHLPERLEQRDMHAHSRRLAGVRRDDTGPVELRRQQSRLPPERGEDEGLVGANLTRPAASASYGQQVRDLKEYGNRQNDLWKPDTPAARERDFRRRLRATGMRDAEIEETLAEWRRLGPPNDRERLIGRTNAGTSAAEQLKPYYGGATLTTMNELNRDWYGRK